MKSLHLVLVLVIQVVLQVVSQEPELLTSDSCFNGQASCVWNNPNGARIAPPLDQQATMMQPGYQVQRGPNWHYGDEDGGEGSVGEVMNWNSGSQYLYWVHWANGNYRKYAMYTGNERSTGTYDVQFSEGQVRSLDDCWDTDENMCANGDQCGDIESLTCGHRTCRNGDFYDCNCAHNLTNVYSQCCVLEGKLHPQGRYNQFCAEMMCVVTPDSEEGFWDWTGHINSDCKRCKAYWDPHVRTFDNYYQTYRYQGCGEYSMAQEGFSYSPEYGIFSKFDERCGYEVSCVLDATMLQDDIKITATSPIHSSELLVSVNDVDYNVPFLAEFVPVNGNDKVLAWKFPPYHNCVYVQGTKGLLMQFCGKWTASNVHIWAMPELHGQVNGLCGSLNNDASDDFITRQGTLLEPLLDSITDFATSWLTDQNSNINCPSRSNLRTQESCEDFDTYKTQCSNTISNFGSHLHPDEINILIDDCTFDLCHVEDPQGYLDDAIVETVKIENQLEIITINLTSSDSCGEGFDSIVGECFKRITTMTTEWESARSLCQAEGLHLAEPWDINAVAAYLQKEYDELFYWVGGRGDGEVARWLSGGEVSSTEPWIRRNYGQISGDENRCLDIVTYGNWPARGETLAAGICNGTQPRATLCSLTRRPVQ